MDTKVLSLIIMREVSGMMAKQEGAGRVVLNMVEPGFRISELLRKRTWTR